MEHFMKSIFFIGALVLVAADGGTGGVASSGAYASSSASSFGGGVGSVHAFAGSGGGGGYPSGYGPPSGYGGPPSYGQGGYGQGGYGGYGGNSGFGGPGYGFPNPPGFADPYAFQKFLQDYLTQMHEWTKMQAQAPSANAIPGCASSDLGDRIGSGGGFPAPAAPASVGGGDGSVGASAVGSIGPGGGYGSTKVFPASGGSGLGDRFGPVKESSGPFSPPAGGNVGISSFSSSSSSDVNGKKTSQKSATVAVNDNGKVTTYTSHDP